jgi:hypothetical protein
MRVFVVRDALTALHAWPCLVQLSRLKRPCVSINPGLCAALFWTGPAEGTPGPCKVLIIYCVQPIEPSSMATPTPVRESPQHYRQALSVLIVSTIAFTVCFMVWMMFGVVGIPIRKTLGLNATEFGLLTATPVLTGSLIRVPLGIWTDRYGGRIVMVLMVCTVPAIWMMSYVLISGIKAPPISGVMAPL